MIIQNIGNRALSLYIDEQELGTLGLSPLSVGLREARIILDRALEDKALDNWQTAEMEVYPGKDSLLLFARRKSERPYHFRFYNSEPLIESALLCPAGLPSRLTLSPEGYILTVYPFEGDRPPSVLSEFGDSVEPEPALLAHFSEQGGEIIPFDAIGTLKEYFRRT